MRKHMLASAVVSCVALVGCGGGAGSDTTTGSGAVTTSPGEVVVTTLGSPATTAQGNTAPTVAAGFPVEIMAGGTIQSSYPTEVTVLYPESSYDALITFYDEWTAGRDVLANDMFPSGRSWQIQEEPLIQIDVTLEEQGAELLARVLP